MSKILILDFGGQYKELIARRIRNMGVDAFVVPCNTPIQDILAQKPDGLIFSGGPHSVYSSVSPRADEKIFSCGLPILGICYGQQYIAHALGGEVSRCIVSEYGKTLTVVKPRNPLFKGLAKNQFMLMSHSDGVTKLPEGFEVVAHTANCKIAGMANLEKNIYAVQFHPEVTRSKKGEKILKNFVFGICRATAKPRRIKTVDDFILDIKNQIGDGKCILGVGGGLTSAVCANLIYKAIGDRLTCVFVDHGMLRANEKEEIEEIYARLPYNFKSVDAKDRFAKALKGAFDAETKRKIIGREFFAVFEEEANKIGADFLSQGTVYSNVIESGAENSANIKSHHNVGGVPKDNRFKGIIEPLKALFKDEVATLAKQLGVPEFFLSRQPFPGPGLGIRIMGEVTADKLEILRKADNIFSEEVEKMPKKKRPTQYFAVITGMRSVGAMGDGRVYDYVIALRAVNTTDFMTAVHAPFSAKTLGKICDRIVNEVVGACRVVYDITDKPPATIEWE